MLAKLILNVKMASGVVLSSNHAVTKTRNAILRMKKCSPELRVVLRQRCQERIQNSRQKILNSFRKINIQDSFREAFGNIIKEEWKSIDEGESSKELSNVTPVKQSGDFNLDDELLLEEMLEKELLAEHEEWLLQLYEELLNEDLNDTDEVVCPVCCSGYLKQSDCPNTGTALCTKCPSNFLVEKSLLDLQSAIYEYLSRHDKQCNSKATFVCIPKSEKDNNLCIVCDQCSYLNIID